MSRGVGTTGLGLDFGRCEPEVALGDIGSEDHDAGGVGAAVVRHDLVAGVVVAPLPPDVVALVHHEVQRLVVVASAAEGAPEQRAEVGE